MVFKIGTLNLCLGLSNKKDIVKQLINENQFDILCLQETELEFNLNHNLLSLPGFNYESEVNAIKSRVGLYVRSNINYVRRTELEGNNSHIVIIDIKCRQNLRIITIYRPFNPQGVMTARDFFCHQLNILKSAVNPNTVILGDFNLDWSKKDHRNYQFNSYFELFDNMLDDENLTQMVNFPTWSRCVNGTKRESTIDHVYASNPTLIGELSSIVPYFGDHLILCFNYHEEKPILKPLYKRNWQHYNKDKLIVMLTNKNWTFESDSVQGYWNEIENQLAGIIDTLAPIGEFINNSSAKSCSKPDFIRKMLNRRKGLLNKLKKEHRQDIKIEIKQIDKAIKGYYHKKKASDVKRTIIPGNSSSLWKAVKIAKDLNVESLPKTLFEEGAEIQTDQVAERFANFFDTKIKNIINSTGVDDEVYNGSTKAKSEAKFFMDPLSVKECMQSLKVKNTEGYDRIPQRVLVDGVDILVNPFSVLFNKIYYEKSIPEQWLIAKTIPIHKNKGEKKNIESYRPIANLCSASKIFEKLILKRILDIQDENKCDFTGRNQHGFKQKRSTCTLSIELQNLIARALDEDKLVLLASLDLSSAFDIVNVDLLIKRLRILGLPKDVIDLINIWLNNRMFYVTVEGNNSLLYELLMGTVQGSILGPVLYAMFVSPLFDLEAFFAFADDIFIPREGTIRQDLIEDMAKSLMAISKWLKQSGLKLNEEKTEMCLFSKSDVATITVPLGQSVIKSSASINVLGVTFDSKLLWSTHINKAISKANKTLNAIKLIRKFFNTTELVSLITSNFYSILYYNSEVWHIHSLKQYDKKQLFTASARALRLANHYRDPMISFQNLHKKLKRATPEMYCDYKLALMLHKTYNDCIPESEWLELNCSQTLMSRQKLFHINKTNHHYVGLNNLSNRFHNLNDKIPLESLNKSFKAYKIEMKKKFIVYPT